MQLETAKKVLKIFGIIGIIFAVLGIILGIMFLAGGGLGATQAQTDEDVAAVGILMVLGIVMIIGCILSLIEGIFSVKASKDGKYGKVAWVFAILSIISSAFSLIGSIMNPGSGSTGSAIVGLIIAITVFVAAKTVKQAHFEGRF